MSVSGGMNGDAGSPTACSIICMQKHLCIFLNMLKEACIYDLLCTESPLLLPCASRLQVSSSASSLPSSRILLDGFLGFSYE
ncbi:hypothetical protein CHS0354_002704 [Potamilus streckersoni]|uniref:Uncharacterized protein n=1 Tax=Potamilus streckersoni TaxID=2493646 RepID=A0AAE0VJW6_9BIVA|nr:hypothetical protein CHS0354_002704 [Potamilus streckersoni]